MNKFLYYDCRSGQMKSKADSALRIINIIKEWWNSSNELTLINIINKVEKDIEKSSIDEELQALLTRLSLIVTSIRKKDLKDLHKVKEFSKDIDDLMQDIEDYLNSNNGR